MNYHDYITTLACLAAYYGIGYLETKFWDGIVSSDIQSKIMNLKIMTQKKSINKKNEKKKEKKKILKIEIFFFNFIKINWFEN